MKKEGKRILIVDDEQANRKILADLLNTEYIVSLAKDGVQGLKKAVSSQPDLILLDILLPDMDGYEVITQLKQNEITRNIPVVFITTLDSIENEAKGLDLGAIDYIAKPFHPSIVKARVKNLMTLVRKSALLERLANLDPLTEMPNRRFFQEALDKEWNRSQRQESPLSLAIMDVDDFKRYNDRYGHSAGDEALKTVASILRDGLKRPGDVAARYGGEEFVMLTPETDSAGASKIAETLRAELVDLNIPHESSVDPPVLTMSIGGVTITPSMSTESSTAMQKADELLYQAKKQGKNKVLWQDL